MDTRACGMGLMRGVYTQYTTENIFCSKNIRDALPQLQGAPGEWAVA
jgi:hypothetical protein